MSGWRDAGTIIHQLAALSRTDCCTGPTGPRRERSDPAPLPVEGPAYRQQRWEPEACLVLSQHSRQAEDTADWYPSVEELWPHALMG